jgi:hypothetical protein
LNLKLFVVHSLLFLCYFPLSAIAASEAQVLTPYEAEYKIYRDGKSVGKAKRCLKQTGTDEFQLSMDSKASVLFFSLDAKELSTLRGNQSNIQGQSYSLWEKRSFKSSNSVQQSFNWENMLETGSHNKKTWQRNFAENSYDPLNYLLRLRQDIASGKSGDLVYMVNDEGQVKNYKLKVTGHKFLTTPIGEFDTILVTRYRDSSSRETSFWLAPDKHYIPIKIRQTKDNEEQATMLIQTLRI